MTDNTSFSLDVVAPVFPVTDIKRALSYYTEKLLFESSFEWADSEQEPLNYAVLRKNAAELHLTVSKDRHATVAYIFVDNVKGYYDAIKDTGAEITHEMADYPWDMREFEIADPDGNRIIFGEHLSRIKTN